MKRKRRIEVTLSGCAEEEEDEVDADQPSKRKSSLQRCACKSGCKTKNCSCKKAGPFCTAICGCNPHKCANREVPGTDVSSAVETDKENDVDEPESKLEKTPSKKTPLLDRSSNFFKTPSSA